MADSTLWLELLEYARWSASPHNIQPWKAKIISETELEIYYLPDRLLPDTDPTGRFTTAGFGIFIENLDVAAHGSGYKIQVQYDSVLLNSKQPEPTLFCRVTLVTTDEKESFNRELIRERRTSRLPYTSEPVAEDLLHELHKIAQDFSEELTYSHDPSLITEILKLNRDTLFYDMADEKARHEVGSWIRYSNSEAYTKKDGLWSYCLGFPGFLLYLFIKMRFFFELPIIKPFIREQYYQTTAGTSTIAWLVGPFSTPQEWFQAGRMLARLWLAMTNKGVYLHPFGSIITNEKAYARLKDLIKPNEKDGVLWLIVRLGHSALPPRSLRLSVEDILMP